MPDESQSNKFSIKDIRKIHPKAGLRWAVEEDELLKKSYVKHRADGGDFDVFILNLSKQFGRALGGMKARLAKYFPDVPGWDYGRDEFRTAELNKKVDALLGTAYDDFLREEYQKYLESKRETYLGFVKRLSPILDGAEGGIIGRRLEQLIGTLEKYHRDDVTPLGSVVRRFIGPDDKQIPQFDFSANTEATKALQILNETSQNLFLTGEAGTGKSTLLQYFWHTTEKNVVVLAPTGVAALNVEGQTVHSFCGFGPDITVSKVKKLAPFSPKFKLLQKLQTIIIDEISMVRADLLDCVDKFLRLNGPASGEPFGGLQMVFIGDLYQLPPVDKDFLAGDGLIKMYNSPYFFDARCFKNAKFQFIQLKTMYRQKEQVFIDVLNAVRNNAATREHLQIINQRSQAESNKFTFEQFAVYLTPTNARARQVNNFFLERVTSELKTYTGHAFGKFEGRELPTDLELQVKIGAQVMMLNNDQKKRWVNGTMGKVVGVEKNNDNNVVVQTPGLHDTENFLRSSPPIIGGVPAEGGGGGNFNLDDYDKNPSSDIILVELETGETVSVEPHTWEMYAFTLDRQTQKIDSRTTGTFTQYPFKLAWAVTIHKAQGKTFDKVYIDLSTGTFAHGQLYVALSRCRTLNGLYLKRPISQADIILDNRIVEFLHSFNSQDPYYSTSEE